MRKILFLLLFFSSGYLCSYSIKIHKPETDIKIATPFSLVFEIEGTSYNIKSISTTSLKGSDFECLGFRIKGKKIIGDFIAFNVGVSTFPAVDIILSDGQSIKTQEVVLEIKPLYDPKETDDIKDIAPIVGFLKWLKFVIIAIVILISYFLYKRFRKKKTNEIQKIIDNRTPYEKALSCLNDLISSKLIEKDVKEYYTKMCDIIRDYIEEEFGLSIKELTTNELIKRLKDEIKFEILIKLKELFEISDLVKFAKYIPFIERTQKDTQLAEEILKLMNDFSIEKKAKKLEEEKKMGLRNEVS